jgi:hypothetical protein
VRDLQVAHQRQGPFVEDLVREGDRTLHQIAFDDAVEQLLPRRLGEQFTGHRLAADDHVQGILETEHARQALRAAGARDQADLHFRQRDLRARRRER